MSDEAFVRPDLPPAEELTPTERRWLGMRLARLRQLGGMTLGTFAEAVVADALPGSVEATGGTARVDISWQPESSATAIGVEVKHSRGGSWNVSERNAREDGERVLRRRADVYVLASHEGEDHRSGWAFYVVPCWRLDGWGRSTVSVARLRNWGVEQVEADALPAAVTTAAAIPPDHEDIVRRDQALRRLRKI